MFGMFHTHVLVSLILFSSPERPGPITRRRLSTSGKWPVLWPVVANVDCEQSLRMVARARKARVRKSSEASESRGEAGEKAGKEGGTAFSFELDVFK